MLTMETELSKICDKIQKLTPEIYNELRRVFRR